MKAQHLLFLAFFTVFSCKPTQEAASETNTSKAQDQAVFRVAFGSCNRQELNNPFWDDVLRLNPQVWIWGGDNIYADTSDMEVLGAMYEAQNEVEGYAQLRANVPVIGTWDDHDYGLNDGGEEFEMKAESQQQFLDFMGVSKTSERRTRKGVYAAHTYETKWGTVKVLVLDTRYSRSRLQRDPNPNRRYIINDSDSATILGSEQWQWLTSELTDSQADFNLIVTSIQFLSAEHGFEAWANFPKEVEKLNGLIASSGANGVILLSGDRHISEFSRANINGLSYPLIDFTSSGLTHSYSNFTSEPNRRRVGEVTSSLSFGVVDLNLESKEVVFRIMGENGQVYQELKQAY